MTITLILKYIIIILIGGSFLFYIGVRLSPSLNPDNKIMGRFDISFVINYSLKYENPNKNNLEEMSRS